MATKKKDENAKKTQKLNGVDENSKIIKKKNKTNKLAVPEEPVATVAAAGTGPKNKQPKNKKAKKTNSAVTPAPTPAATPAAAGAADGADVDSQSQVNPTVEDQDKIESKKNKKLAQKAKKELRKEKAQVAASEALSKAGTSAAGKKPKKKVNADDDDDDDESERKARDPALDAATVFVGNLPVNIKRVQIVKIFKDYAPVKSIRLRTAAGKIIFKHKQRKGAGSLNAYVQLKDAETAEKALQLNNVEVKEHHLRVTRVDVQQVSTDPKRTIFVGNLKYSANEEKLREIFSSCGEIDYIRCLRDGDKGCNGVAYVCFQSPEAVGLALELKETMLDERPIHVEHYSAKKQGAKKARDESGASNKNAKPTGAKGRLANKQKSKGGQEGAAADKKKGEFRGVKVNGINKKQNKKKKPTSEMQKLSKKIAPKAK